jgi:hypothetical protein
MRSLKSGLVVIALSGLFGTVAVVGCSAEGTGGVLAVENDPTAPAPTGGSKLPPRGEDPTPGVSDGGKTDGGKKDGGPKAEAGVDAGPPPPVAGAACSTPNAIVKKPCGACGTTETVCLDDGKDAGTGTWSPYSLTCVDEIPGGCVPGSTAEEACGNCGTVKKTCTQFCEYSTTACQGEPKDSCVPGTVGFTTAGCVELQTYRNRTCGDACTWGNFSATCEGPTNANKLTISDAVNGTVAGTYLLSAAKMGSKVTGSCPTASVSSTTDHPYEIVEVKNATAQTAKVSAWLTGTPAIDTVMNAYATNLAPETAAALKACTVGVNDFCPSTLPCGADDDWSGLTGSQTIVIPPGQVVLIRFASYYPKSSASYVTTGNATLTVRTDVLQ